MDVNGMLKIGDIYMHIPINSHTRPRRFSLENSFLI